MLQAVTTVADEQVKALAGHYTQEAVVAPVSVTTE